MQARQTLRLLRLSNALMSHPPAAHFLIVFDTSCRVCVGEYYKGLQGGLQRLNYANTCYPRNSA
jgi:hypothetical protein